MEEIEMEKRINNMIPKIESTKFRSGKSGMSKSTNDIFKKQKKETNETNPYEQPTKKQIGHSKTLSTCERSKGQVTGTGYNKAVTLVWQESLIKDNVKMSDSINRLNFNCMSL